MKTLLAGKISSEYGQKTRQMDLKGNLVLALDIFPRKMSFDGESPKIKVIQTYKKLYQSQKILFWF